MSMNYDLTIGYNTSTYWLLLSGAVTSIPLLLFSASAKNVPLSLMAFIINGILTIYRSDINIFSRNIYL